MYSKLSYGDFTSSFSFDLTHICVRSSFYWFSSFKTVQIKSKSANVLANLFYLHCKCVGFAKLELSQRFFKYFIFHLNILRVDLSPSVEVFIFYFA